MIDWLVTAIVLLLGVFLMASGLIVWLYVGFMVLLVLSIGSKFILIMRRVFKEKDK